MQVVVERLESDGFVDWSQFGSLVMEARSCYYRSLFKMIDLKGRDQIGKAEMDNILARIKNQEFGKHLEELFYIMLKNFGQESDGTIDIVDFINAIKNMKF